MWLVRWKIPCVLRLWDSTPWGSQKSGPLIVALTRKAVKEGVSERIVIVVTRIKAVWDAREGIIEISVNRRVKGIGETESAIER